MIVTVDNIVNGITKFIETDLFDKASGYQKFLVALLSARVNGKLKDVIMPFAAMFTNSNNEIELSELTQSLNQALNKVGNNLNIPLLNYNFDSQDLNKIINYIRTYANE